MKPIYILVTLPILISSDDLGAFGLNDLIGQTDLRLLNYDLSEFLLFVCQ